MGASPSTNTVSKLKASEAEVVKLMMPVYFTQERLTPEERKLAKASWDSIVNDKSPEYISRRGTEGFPYNCCVTFFYDSFYTRLFDIHPMSRQLFVNGMRSQGKFLVKMIGLALSDMEHEHPEVFDKTLVHLAHVHFERGVKSVEYGIVGEVLFWCMRTVLGAGTYNASLHRIWTKVFSRMIHTIIPTAVALELRGSKGTASGQNSTNLRSNSMSRDVSISGTYNNNSTMITGGGGCPEGISTAKCPVGHDTIPEDSSSTQQSIAGRNISHRFASCRSAIEEEQEDALMERLETDSYISTKSHFQEEENMLRAAESTRSHLPFRSTF